jgi:hypothetical protein
MKEDIRMNNEDLVLTPFIGFVRAHVGHARVYGLSLTWGYYSIHIALGWRLPKNYPNVFFKTKTRNTFNP